MAITKAVKEAIWLHGLLKDLGVGQKQLELYSDSQSAIYKVSVVDKATVDCKVDFQLTDAFAKVNK